MKQHDVFTLDQAAIDELKLDTSVFQAGQQFRITQPVNSVEVRASRIVDGKPQKGRPRRFPTSVVARLMGETVPTTTLGADEAVDVDESVEEVTQTPEETEEERARRLESQERLAASVAGDNKTTVNDW